jgi:hypothetical protein
MGRIKPETVSDLMDVANRFADGEDACNNKRTRSPEDDRGNRYGGQRRRSRNYDNYGSHSQVAAGYKDNSYQSNDRKSLGYRSYGKEDYKFFFSQENLESTTHHQKICSTDHVIFTLRLSMGNEYPDTQ